MVSELFSDDKAIEHVLKPGRVSDDPPLTLSRMATEQTTVIRSWFLMELLIQSRASAVLR